MISNVHLRLMYKVVDNSGHDGPKYYTVDIPVSDRMIDITADPVALENAQAEIERLRKGYSECIDGLMRVVDIHAGCLYTAGAARENAEYGDIVQRHRDILKGSAKS